jgi:hypothetical protein
VSTALDYYTFSVLRAAIKQLFERVNYARIIKNNHFTFTHTHVEKQGADERRDTELQIQER